ARSCRRCCVTGGGARRGRPPRGPPPRRRRGSPPAESRRDCSRCQPLFAPPPYFVITMTHELMLFGSHGWVPVPPSLSMYLMNRPTITPGSSPGTGSMLQFVGGANPPPLAVQPET